MAKNWTKLCFLFIAFLKKLTVFFVFEVSTPMADEVELDGGEVAIDGSLGGRLMKSVSNGDEWTMWWIAERGLSMEYFSLRFC